MNGEEAIVRPHAVLRWRRGSGAPATLLQSAVLVTDRGLVEEMRRHRRGRSVSGPSGPLVTLGGAVGVAAPPGIGAPAAAIAVEELAALGARQIVAVGFAGGLDEGLRPGDVVVLEAALRGEGVSRHYLPDEPSIAADRDLTVRVAGAIGARGLEVRLGTGWTTDALYRETPSAVRAAHAGGAIVVDLEAAAVLAVARALGVAAAAVVVVGDGLGSGSWEPPADLRAVRETVRRIVGAVLDSWSPER